MRIITVCLLAGLVGCSAAQVQKDQVVLMQLKADAKTVLVTGCADLPATEVLVGVIAPVVPQLAASAPTIAAAEGLANQVCAAVKAAQAQPPAPVVAK